MSDGAAHVPGGEGKPAGLGARLYSRWQAPPPEALTPRRLELRRMGDAMREVIDRLVFTDAPVELLTAAADSLERIAEEFGESRRRSTYDGFAEATLAGGDAHALFEQSPFIGRANPLAPPIELWETDHGVGGRVNFGSAYEGPPGCVHGGYIAGAFDEVLGATQTLSGQAGMTGTLTIRYRSPTPLHAELTFAAKLDRVDGRKIFASATLSAGDRLCAEADAIFVSIDPGVFMRLKDQRDEQELRRE
jgi:acyl-coenzyme A thioesterase PaaI-like protein